MFFPWNPCGIRWAPGGGTWNRRPALPWTLWRLRNNEALEAQWRVAELKAYRDPLCLAPWHGMVHLGPSGYDFSRSLGEKHHYHPQDKIWFISHVYESYSVLAFIYWGSE